MPRPVIGILTRAAKSETRFVHLHDLLHESVDVTFRVYNPMVEAVLRFRELADHPTITASDEDKQVMEELMTLTRQLSYYQNRMRKILRRGLDS